MKTFTVHVFDSERRYDKTYTYTSRNDESIDDVIGFQHAYYATQNAEMEAIEVTDDATGETASYRYPDNPPYWLNVSNRK